MARSQVRNAQALKTMRERQRELDRDEDQRRKASRERIAAASADASLALSRHALAVQAVDSAAAEVGNTLRVLLAEQVHPQRVAALLDLSVAQVRGFTRAADRFGEEGR